MADSTKSQLPATFVRAWRDWWAKVPIPERLTAGIVRRANVGVLLDEAAPLSADAVTSMLDEIDAALNEIIGSAQRWSPVPGLIDIHYAKTSSQTADLKHSVVVSAIEKCLRAARGAPASGAGANKDVPRRVDWERFQSICAKAQVRPDQIQTLDVGEALFGTSEPDMKLSLRVWNQVDEILDESLATGGYCTRYTRNRVLLFFPGYSKAMGELKRKSIAQEIADATRGMAVRAQPEDTAGEPARKAEPAPRPRAPVAGPTIDDKERAQLNQAYAALAASRDPKLRDPGELEFPEGYGVRVAPTWMAKKRTVGGSILEPIRMTGGEAERYFPSADDPFEGLDLPVLAHGASRIAAQVQAGKASLVIIPVYWAYLDQTKRRTRYLDFCSKLPEPVRRLLVFELAGMPEDLMTARVEDRLTQLRQYSRGIVCRVRLARRDFSQFNNLQLHAVGVDFGELPDYERGIIPAFDAFMDALEPSKLRSYAHGLTSKSMLMAVQAAGVDYVSGPVIPESDVAPLGIREFEIADLYELPSPDAEKAQT